MGSIEAAQPVFWIVMGVALMIVSWRLSRKSSGATRSVLVAGSLLLGIGYAIVLPLPATNLLPARGEAGAELAIPLWRASKLVTMNAGWLLLGIGIALHAKLLSLPQFSPRAVSSPLPPNHESIA